MRVAITGATGLIGRRVVAALKERGDEVTTLSRDPQQGVRWDPLREPAPAQALAGRDAVVHLAGENIAQRWSAAAKRAIRESRVTGTRNLVQGIGQLAEAERPRQLVSGSAIGYYGAPGGEPIDEDGPAGSGFLAQTC